MYSNVLHSLQVQLEQYEETEEKEFSTCKNGRAGIILTYVLKDKQ